MKGWLFVKINIVVNSSLLETDRILSRLAKDLPYTIKSIPDDNADINYFFPYMEYPKEGYTKTKTAAWFTHLDKNVSNKVKTWERVAKAVDLRLTSALIYQQMLEQYGVTRIVTPSLDHNLFNLE